ncbi:LysR family transcriptional regulator [Rhizobium sp. 1AS11]|uniref:LysR family transcriptional regulator n=1 Tax=Rhizobium acaciae TaxID=2989736 RepID=UPI0022223F2E|nr:LysR family transcriptional regulator [Rhizobium acaciae]MCW1411310.1 LysR family transcriptional regulator [Rhizobium acaciae]MCW1743278.1 LysR family transcriptional regulator [Rhizobium acaciae]
MSDWEPNLRQLRAFEATASLASISQAAEKLHLSQSAISQSIANLEASLGLPLFQRRSNGSFVTHEGEVFRIRVARALRRIEIALAAAAEAGRGTRGVAEPMPGNVTSVQISALIAIDEHGSYSAAAAALGISQPSLNRHARDIETILRRTLFSRTSQGKATTRIGRELARELRLAMKEVQYGQDELAAIKGESHGTIVIGILPLGASLLVSQGLGQLSRKFPRMKAQIVESPFEALLNWLQTGRIDVIIGTLRPDPLGSDVDESPLFPDPYCLVVRRAHPLCNVRHVDESDLRQYEWILPRQGTPRRIAVEALFETLKPRPTTIVETSSMGLTRDLLLNGDRVTLLSRDQIMFEDRLDLLRVLDFPLPTSSRVIGSIIRSDWLPTELQQNFLSILQELAKDAMPSPPEEVD